MVWQALQRLPGPALASACVELLAPACQWHCVHPINTLVGPEAVADGIFAPLARAFPDLKRRADLYFGGHWDGQLDGGAGW